MRQREAGHMETDAGGSEREGLLMAAVHAAVCVQVRVCVVVLSSVVTRYW